MTPLPRERPRDVRPIGEPFARRAIVLDRMELRQVVSDRPNGKGGGNRSDRAHPLRRNRDSATCAQLFQEIHRVSVRLGRETRARGSSNGRQTRTLALIGSLSPPRHCWNTLRRWRLASPRGHRNQCGNTASGLRGASGALRIPRLTPQIEARLLRCSAAVMRDDRCREVPAVAAAAAEPRACVPILPRERRRNAMFARCTAAQVRRHLR